MATIYVDPLNGTDNADAGRGETDGTSAYASISYALANYGSFSTTEGNKIYLADTAADVLSSALSFYGAGLTGANYPMVVEGYHYDGSNGGTAGALTVSLPFGRSISGGEIDGNDAVATLTVTNERYLTFRNLKCHSTTGPVLYMAGISSYVENCEVYNGATTYTMYPGNAAMNCKVYSDVSVTAHINGGYQVMFCEVSGTSTWGLWQLSNYATFAYNLIYDCIDNGVHSGANYGIVTHNTIDGTGANSDAIGVEFYSGDGHVCRDNLIANFSGATAKGVYSASGVVLNECGNNAFYNITTDEDLTNAPAVSLTNIAESSDPFTNRSTGDYSLVSGANSNDSALYEPYGADLNIGAWQEKPTGSTGETVKAFGY